MTPGRTIHMLVIGHQPAALAFICAMTVLPAYAWEEGVCQGKSTVEPPEARSPVPGNRQCGIFLDGKYQNFVIDILNNKRGCAFKKSNKICLNQNGHKILLHKYSVKIINPNTKTEMCDADLNHPMDFQTVFTSDCKDLPKKP
jgi:hypothetical protein